MQLKPIHEQVVVIFGASSGIGRAAALRFAQRGARVVVAARSDEGIESLVEEIRALGGHVSGLTADAMKYAEVKAVAERAIEDFDGLDTWVHCAAVSLYARFADTTPEEFKHVIEVDLVGQAYGAMAALQHMRKRGGALIHISSIEARRALPYQSAYAAAKHGIAGMTEALRLELMHDRVPVSVTNIMPATINTPLFDKARTKLGVKPVGMPPIYQPEVVVDAILYAAEHPARDIVVGGAAKMFSLGQRLSPALMDQILLRTAFEGQRTDQPKGIGAPDNLIQPIAGYNKTEGDLPALRHSTSNWPDTHPSARRVAIGLIAGAGVLLGMRALLNGRRAAPAQRRAIYDR